MQYFTIFKDKLHLFNIQNHRSTRGLRETVQKISKITYTANRFLLLTSAKFAVNIKRVTLQHIWAPWTPKVARRCDSKHWYTCGADGRLGGRAVYGHVITKFSGIGRFT